ncbi:reticulocyte binding protein 1b, putative [Plasmodium ovale]|uniref:Reticulocyte binding protein 1b n=2 Tax=Plasmodium ovale TaxID=36330 RepID=A0A1A8VMX1_PLAOA|nr:reticulocyte binding protein 1b [Plasmodium ovale curtisi]SCQ16015.1 reticulocyte binding protein 1b, putative [Plasmodium ovale]
MRKSINWISIVHLLFIVFDIYEGINVSEKIKKNSINLNFLSFDPSLKKNKKLNHNTGEKEYLRSLDSLSKNVYSKKINKENNEDKYEDEPSSNSHKSASFLSLNNDKLSGAAEDPSSEEGKQEHSENALRELENSKDSSVHSSDKKSKFSIYFEDYIKKAKESNPIFLMELDYVDLQALKEITYLVPSDKPYNKFYTVDVEKKILEYTNKLKTMIINSMRVKNAMIKIEAKVKLDKNEVKEESLQDEVLNEFESKKKEYENYIDEYKNVIKHEINKIKSEAYEKLKSSHCKRHCREYVLNHARLLNKYVRNISNIKNEPYITIPKSVNDYSSLDKILKLSKQENIDIDEAMLSLKLLGEEVKDVKYVYVINRSLIDDASKILLDMHRRNVVFNTKEEKIVNNAKQIANNYCAFHHLIILNAPIKEMYEEKIKKSNELISTIINKFKENAYSTHRSVFVEAGSDKIRRDSEQIVEDAKKIHEGNRRKIDFFSRYPSIKIQPDMETLEAYYSADDNNYQEILYYYGFICQKHIKIYSETKMEYLNELDTIVNYKNDTTKAELLLEEIAKINSEKENVEDNLEKLKSFYDHIVHLKNSMSEINVEITSDKQEADRLREMDDKIAKYTEEIKETLRDMIKKLLKLKEVVILRDKGREDIAKINELINAGSYSDIDKFKNARDKSNNDISSLLKFLYEGDIDNLIEIIGDFISKKKKNMSEKDSLEKIEQNRSEIKSMYEKMATITYEKLKTVYDKISEEINITENLKNDVARHQSVDLYKEMEESSKKLKVEYDALLKSMGEYENQEEVIRAYKDSTLEKENQYFNTLYVDDDASEKENTSKYISDLKEYFLRIKTEISTQLGNTKNVMSSISRHFKFYNNIEKYFYLLSDINFIEIIKSLKQNIHNEITRENIREYERLYAHKTDAINETIKSIESLNKTVSSLNSLNNGVNKCKYLETSIGNLGRKISNLKQNLQSEIEAIKKDSFIRADVKNEFLSKLNGNISQIDKRLKEINIDDMLKNSEELKNFYFDLKNVIHAKKQEQHLQPSLSKINDWELIRIKFDELNASYNIFSENKDKLFLGNSSKYLEFLHNLIKETIKNTQEKKYIILKSVQKMKEKLYNLQMNRNYKRVRSAENEGAINSIKEVIAKMKENIDGFAKQLTKHEVDIANLINNPKNKENDINHLREIIEKVKNVYYELEKIPVELIKVENELERTQGSVSEVELQCEKKLIDDILKIIREKKIEAEESIQKMISLKSKIEETIKETADPHDSELTAENCENYLQRAKKYEEEINEIEKVSTQWKEDSYGIAVLNDVMRIKEKLYENMKKAMSNYDHINESFNAVKEVNELILSTNYNTIINFIKRNSNEANKYRELVKMELTKSEDAVEQVKINFQKATNLKEKINKDLGDQDIDGKVKEIEAIKEEVLEEIKNVQTYLSDAEKYKTICLSHLENANKGKEKIVHLRDHTNRGDSKITYHEIEIVENNIKVLNQYFSEANKNAQETKQLYESILEYERKMNNLLNESLTKRARGKCEKREKEVGEIMNEISAIDARIKEELNKFEHKINEMKKQSSVEKNGEQYANKKSMESLLQIENCIQELENVMINIKNVKQETQQFLQKADDLVKSTLSTSALSNDNSLDTLKVLEDNLKAKLTSMQNEKQHMFDEEMKLNIINRDMMNIENDLEKYKKEYEVGLLKKIKEKADQGMKNFELTKKEVNSLIDPSSSIFVQFKQGEYNIMNHLNNYQTEMKKFQEEINELYKLIEKRLSEKVISSATYIDVKHIRVVTQREEEGIREKDKAAKELLENIKKKELERLINDMKERMQRESEQITTDYTEISEHMEKMKANIDHLKELTDINNGLKILNDSVSSLHEIKKKEPILYKKEAESIFESMVRVANHFLNDEIEIGQLLQLNLSLFSLLKSDIEKYLFTKIKESYGILSKIEEHSSNIVKNQREGERLVTQANTIYSMKLLRNEFTNRKDEINRKQHNVLNKIDDALNKLKQINSIQFRYENYANILQNSEEYDKFMEIQSLFESNKNRLVEEREIRKMKDDLDSYKHALIDLDKIVESSNESNFEIGKLQSCKANSEEIMKRINFTDNNIMKIIFTFDELLELGKLCQIRWISLISKTVNTKASRYLIKIRKQKESTEKCLDYIKNNHVSVTKYASELNQLHGYIIENGSVPDNTSNADKYSKEFREKEQKAIEIVKHIKKELYSFDKTTDMETAEVNINNIKEFYDKLVTKKLEIDDIYNNMNATKLKEIEGTCDVFNPVAEMFSSIEENKRKELLERESQLENIHDFVKGKENDLVHACNTYTPESIGNIDEIYKSIEHEIKKLDNFKMNIQEEDENIQKQEDQVLHLLDITDKLLKELEMLQNENKNNLVEDETETINEINENVNTITHQLNDLKKLYQKILDYIKQNMHLSSNIALKKGNISRTLEKLINLKVTLLKKLAEEEKLHKIQNKLEEINAIIEKNVEHRIDKKMEKMSKNVDARKVKAQTYKTVDEIEKEISSIKNDNNQLKDDKLIVEKVLEDAKKKEDEMNKIFNLSSKDGGLGTHKHVELIIDNAINLIDELSSLLRKMERIINDNELLMQKLYIQKGEMEEENITKELADNTNIKGGDKNEQIKYLGVTKSNLSDTLHKGPETAEAKKTSIDKKEDSVTRYLTNGDIIKEMRENEKGIIGGKRSIELTGGIPDTGATIDEVHYKENKKSDKENGEQVKKEKIEKEKCTKQNVCKTDVLGNRKNLEEKKYTKEGNTENKVSDTIHVPNYNNSTMHALNVSEEGKTNETSNDYHNRNSVGENGIKQFTENTVLLIINYKRIVLIILIVCAFISCIFIYKKIDEKEEDTSMEENESDFADKNKLKHRKKEEFAEVSFVDLEDNLK